MFVMLDGGRFPTVEPARRDDSAAAAPAPATIITGGYPRCNPRHVHRRPGKATAVRGAALPPKERFRPDGPGQRVTPSGRVLFRSLPGCPGKATVVTIGAPAI